MKFHSYFESLRMLIQAATSSQDAQARTVLFLHNNFANYNWVGIYRLEVGSLVLGPWQGKAPTRHNRIPIGQGVCGACAVSCKTEVVADVAKDTRYLACFPETRAEIVVPIVQQDRFWGEIDIDSSRPGAFTADDVEFLEAAAAELATRV